MHALSGMNNSNPGEEIFWEISNSGKSRISYQLKTYLFLITCPSFSRTAELRRQILTHPSSPSPSKNRQHASVYENPGNDVKKTLAVVSMGQELRGGVGAGFGRDVRQSAISCPVLIFGHKRCTCLDCLVICWEQKWER